MGEKDLSATFPLVSFGPFHMSEEPAANVCHKDAHEEFVFTYGTLKRGFHNHEVLGNSRFVAEAMTVKPFRLVHPPGYSFPFLLDVEGGVQVTGELYVVDEETLKRLDWLESAPMYEFFLQSLFFIFCF